MRKSKRRNREKACEFAALLMGNDHSSEDWGQRLWSATVFFEAYMERGAAGTRNDFGPKAPTELRPVQSP